MYSRKPGGIAFPVTAPQIWSMLGWVIGTMSPYLHECVVALLSNDFVLHPPTM